MTQLLRIVPYGTEVFACRTRWWAKDFDDIEVERLYVISQPGESVRVGISLHANKASYCQIELPPQYRLSPQEAVEAYVEQSAQNTRDRIDRLQSEIAQLLQRLPKFAAVDWTKVPVTGHAPDYQDPIE